MNSRRDRPTPPTAAQVEGAGQVLELIRREKAQTVSQLARAVGVARSTILQRVDYLTRMGLVVSEMQVLGSRGRPPAALRFDPSCGVVLAAQVGLTGFRTALTDLGGTVLADRYDDLDLVSGPQVLLDALNAAFDALSGQTRLGLDRLAGVGVGTPSTLEMRGYARSQGVDATDWSRAFFEEALRERYQVPVFLDLDVNLLALAEQRTSWPDAEAIVCVKLGTLIDSALVVRGVPVRGSRGLAGELGHIKVSGSTAACACGSTGCLDAVASGSALVRRLAGQGFPVTHVRDVMRLAADGVPEALHAIRDAGRHIGEALSAVVNLLNPAAITSWGYLTDSDVLFAGIRESLYGMALPASTEGLELVRTSLGDLAGVRGAAMRVIDEILAPESVDRVIRAQTWTQAEASS